MGDLMRPLALEDLIRRMILEYTEQGSIFGIPASRIYRKSQGKEQGAQQDGRPNEQGAQQRDQSPKRATLFGHTVDTPIGPAAGPHTQLAQNIITSYLAGGRFIELKTVQIMDTLEIDKPCIDARDEAYNVEWSTEYTLPKAYRE